jgi:hypothetical protein
MLETARSQCRVASLAGCASTAFLDHDGSCIRLRPERPGHVWAYDFVEDRTHDGRKLRMLTVVDEFSRECLAITVARRLNSDDVLATLADLFVERGPPEHIRSDQGQEFIAKTVRAWLGRLGVHTLYIEKASPWENGYNESFNGKLRDELLNAEVFYTLMEAKVLIEAWRQHYNVSSQRTSRYVIDGKRVFCVGSGPAGYFARARTRKRRLWTTGPSRLARLKSQGPSSSGCTASISPRSAARRRVFGAMPIRAAAWVRLSQGSTPSSARR